MKRLKHCFSKIQHRSGARYHKAADPQCKPQKERRRFSIFLRNPLAVSSRPCQKTVPLRSRKYFVHALFQLGSADAVCISFPLCVDGLPSYLAEFLSLAEEYCKARSLRFRLYAIANNDFIEGQQNRTHCGYWNAGVCIPAPSGAAGSGLAEA